MAGKNQDVLMSPVTTIGRKKVVLKAADQKARSEALDGT